ncbi:MAG: cupredoxin family copper-binding protein [Candidatus Aenigmarchaeota archaeon]|nr:cupredoxin family copper-binding protein [Candidatus Aenigmarchaeota archaeon]
MNKAFIFVVIILLAAVVVVSGCIGQSSTNNTNVKNNTQSTEPVIEPSCHNYFWYDNTNKDCGSKEFCGAYMYLGLNTFETKDECLKSVQNTQTTSNETPPSPPAETPPGQLTIPVEIKNFAFDTPTMTIHKGDTVVWTNSDAASHTVTSDSGSELGSQTLNKGDSYTHTFNTSGTFNYHCAFHSGMKATVIVE